MSFCPESCRMQIGGSFAFTLFIVVAMHSRPPLELVRQVRWLSVLLCVCGKAAIVEYSGFKGHTEYTQMVVFVLTVVNPMVLWTYFYQLLLVTQTEASIDKYRVAIRPLLAWYPLCEPKVTNICVFLLFVHIHSSEILAFRFWQFPVKKEKKHIKNCTEEVW